MARTNIPDAMRMKILKYEDGSAEQRNAVLAALQAAGRRSEALLLLEGHPDHPAVRDEAQWAVSEGNGFHLLAVRRIGGTVTDDELRACAGAAEGRGRWLDARLCYLALADESALLAIAEHLPESMRPAPEAAEDSDAAE